MQEEKAKNKAEETKNSNAPTFVKETVMQSTDSYHTKEEIENISKKMNKED